MFLIGSLKTIKIIDIVKTLDPKAKGVLPIAIGDATKLMSYVVDKEKQYKFSIKWGQQTTTDDKEGEIIESKEWPLVDECFLEDDVLCSYQKNELDHVLQKIISINPEEWRAYEDLAT